VGKVSANQTISHTCVYATLKSATKIIYPFVARNTDLNKIECVILLLTKWFYLILSR